MALLPTIEANVLLLPREGLLCSPTLSLQRLFYFLLKANMFPQLDEYNLPNLKPSAEDNWEATH